MSSYPAVIFLAAYAASMTISQHSPALMSMTETQLMNLTCKVPSSLQLDELYQLEISFSRRTNFSHSLVRVSRQEYYKDLSFGYVPDLFNSTGQLFERDATNSFLTSTFPLTENTHGLYSCTTSYRLRDETKSRKESASFYIAGPSTIKKNESFAGFSVNFTPVLRVQGTWILPALQKPTLVSGSINISEKFVVGDGETCSSDHPDIAALNFSYVYHSAKSAHIFTLDLCIKSPTRCGSVVYIKGEENVFIKVQVNLNPEIKEGVTSTDSVTRHQPQEKGSDTNTHSPSLHECTHHLNEQRVIFTFLGLFMGISLNRLFVCITRFCKKRTRKLQDENNKESGVTDSLLGESNCGKTEVVAMGDKQDIAPVSSEKTLEVVVVGDKQDLTVSMMSQDVQLRSGRTADHAPGSVTLSGDPLRSGGMAEPSPSSEPLTASHRTTTVTDLEKGPNSVIPSGVPLGSGENAGHRESARPVCQPELDGEAVDDSVRSGSGRVIVDRDGSEIQAGCGNQVRGADLNPIPGSTPQRHPPATGGQGYPCNQTGVQGDAGENAVPPDGLVKFREE